ncbi:hypothetical protein [Clostridium sp.]|jgi:predicted transcriptional regulator YheO|uniref:hypothetical protein n=1 Tax=Clostridium sp. TaxID=1506 RepID=UPI0029047097|nr:hypothetical protein [Clostridium sp.]MDU2285442.1 hypothetical protein [Clostridium sp.]
MYDINQVAQLTGISKVSVYKKLKKLKGIEQYIVKEVDKTYVLEEGVRLIRDSLQVNSKVKNDIDEECAISDGYEDLTVNKQLINGLLKQLDEKDKQIQDLHKQIEELINLNKNNQVLLKQQQDKEINQKLLEDHFQEVDEKLMDLRERMDEKKKSKKKFGFFSK